MDILSEQAQEYIDILDMRSKNIPGLMSSVFMGKCYLTDKMYDFEDEGMYQRAVDGTFHMYPYNTIQFYKDNEWLFDCLQTLFIINNNRLPHSFKGTYHNLPHIVKIKRSNGVILDAITVDNDLALRIYKSTSRNDKVPRIYVRVKYFADMIHIQPSDVYGLTENGGYLYKDVSLEDIILMNPQIVKRGLKIKLPKLEIDDEMGSEEREIKTYINTLYENWGHDVLEPVIGEYDKIVKITYSFT